MRAYTDNRRSEVNGDWPALTPALSMNRPPHPVPLPLRGGEGARRAGEGGGSWSRCAVGKPWELSMNLLRVADPRSGARLCEAQRFMVPMRVQSWRSRLSMNLTLVGTSRCDVPAREAAGGIIAPLNAARTAQRAVPTRFEGARRDKSSGSL